VIEEEKEEDEEQEKVTLEGETEVKPAFVRDENQAKLFRIALKNKI